MKQRLHLFLLFLASLLGVPAVQAQQLLRIFTEENSTLTIAYLNEVPTTWQGYAVTQAKPYDPAAPTHSSDDDNVDVSEATTQIVIDASVEAYRPTSLRGFFAGFPSAEHITGLEYLHTEGVTDMSSCFEDCYALTSVDLSHFNTANVTTMQAMFVNCSALAELDLSAFNTERVTDMSQMFSGCASLSSLDLSGLNTSQVTTMEGMFSDCAGLKEVKLSALFDTQKVTTMRDMFVNCQQLVDIDFSLFRTPAVTTMSGMFSYCEAFEDLCLSTFNTSAVTDMSRMFYGCTKLRYLDISAFSTGQVVTFTRMFGECQNLQNLLLDHFDGNRIGQDTRTMRTAAEGVFEGCHSLAFIDLSEATNFSDTWLAPFLQSAPAGTLKYLPEGAMLTGENYIRYDGTERTTDSYVIFDATNTYDKRFKADLGTIYPFVAKNVRNLRVLNASDGATTWFAPYEVLLPQGYEAYTFTKADATTATATFTLSTTSTLLADTAYLLIPTSATGETIFEPMTNAEGNIEVHATMTELETYDAESGVRFVGTNMRYANAEAIDEQFYSIGKDQQWLPFTAHSNDAFPLRAYLSTDKAITAFTTTTQQPTAIRRIALQGGTADGQVYDLNGRALNTHGTALPKGIYITAGKKVWR